MHYEIKGGSMPIVEVLLENGESIRCETGAMTWMSDNMEMDTKGGGLGKMLGRAFSGESMFQNIYTAKGGQGRIAFGSSYMGSIVPYEIKPGNELIIQKTAYLCSTMGVGMEVYFQKKIAGGLFGGEGFIMQKLSGEGMAFLEIDGSAIEYDLAPGEKMIVSTGHLAMMDATCSMDVETQRGGLKNIAFGGEGLFNTVVTGPGRIVLQTMPKVELANSISPYIPSKS